MSREILNGSMAPLLIVLVTVFVATDCLNVLYLATVPSKSHGNLGQGYIRGLLKKGHQVTYITPFPQDNPPENLTQIDLHFVFDILPPDDLKIASLIPKNEVNILHEWIVLMGNLTHYALSHKTVQSFIHDKSQNFDLVVVDWLYNEVLAGFSALYQCPFVWSNSLDVHSGIMTLMDEPGNPAYTDDVMLEYPKPFTFLQRVEMLWLLLGNIFLVESLKPAAVSAYEEIFSEAAASRGVTLPPYKDLIYNASLMLSNTHPALASSNKLPQNVKSIGGYYIEEPTKPLPSDLQKIMDEAKDGVIYFSLGSNAESKHMPHEMRNDLIKMFGGLKQTVLWKFEEDVPDLPKNLIIRKWLPQSSILAHPNIKIFITHGGMLSTVETVHYGVPIVAVPLYGDQFLNTRRAVNKGFAVSVKISYNLADDLKVAIHEVLTNPTYTTTVKRVSALYHDRPVRAFEELVYWLEYAVRTGGAPHLRSAALLLPWYQRLYLDLLALIIAVMATLVLLVKYLVRSWLCKSKDVKIKIN